MAGNNLIQMTDEQLFHLFEVNAKPMSSTKL
jgi:hypothetical protein